MAAGNRGSVPAVAQVMKGFAVSLLTVWLGAYATFIALISIHDYPQTRQVIALVNEDESYPDWLPMFYLLNEAGSGIKYSLTGNPRHFRHFPTSEYVGERREEFFLFVHNRALQGDWCAQLLLSRLYAQGLGHSPDPDAAVRWYMLASLRFAQEIAVPPEQVGGELAGLGIYLASRITEEDRERAREEAKRYLGAGLRCQDRSISPKRLV